MGDWPLEHLFYIPAILLVGVALGFRLGAKAAREELAKRRRERLR
ncbi:MAG: hypothetical protein AAGH15_21190 [Myxococcota bacterium]